MDYANSYTNFSHIDTYQYAVNHASRGTKEFYLRAGKAASLPQFLRYLNYYLLLNDVVVYLPAAERITRSTGLEYYFSTLTRLTNVQADDTQYNCPLLYSNVQLDAFNLKDISVIHFVEVTGQIQDTFERAIPNWARDAEASEQLGISLALKLTPKHRIRVYTRNNHIIVFTTKGMSDAYDSDYKLYRKLWACLPLLRDWVNKEDAPYPELVELCKTLDKDDSTRFWELLEEGFDNNPVLKDLKYSAIIQTFNNIAISRQQVIERQITDSALSAQRWLDEYAKALNAKRDAERRLLELQQSDIKIETETIKMLVDKKICYGLDISNITNGDGSISYRCSAPLLSYDKEAAKAVYRRRVKIDYTNALPKLFELLFIDEKVVLLFDQAIDIKLNRGTFTARNGETRLYTDLNNSLPNPHHYFYNCWGSYGSVIVKLINEYKLEEIFYQIKAAMGSLNFSDPPVIGQFLVLLNKIVEGYYNPACFYWREENCTKLHTLEETLKHFREETTE